MPFRTIRAAGSILLMFIALTGLIYPLIITGIAQLVFPDRANGCLIRAKGTPVGSALIGQPFAEAKYFWSRPSATTSVPYNAAASGGSNLGPTNPVLQDSVEQRLRRLRMADPARQPEVPVDLVTASAGGLDPHISIAAALYQIPRVACARGMSEAELRQIVDRHTEGRTLGFLGEPRVNVLMLNLDLDRADNGGRQ